MASTAGGRLLTESHRLAQARLGAQTVQQMLAAWALLDPDQLDGTTPRWLRVTVPVIQRQRIASARLAAAYISAYRRLELGTIDSFVPRVVVSASVASVATSLTVTGPVAVKRALLVAPVVARAMEIGRTMSAGAAMRHALGGGRDTVVQSVRDDDRALGWARATSGRACAFCAMLASRGPVYREDTVRFEAHDHCSCGVEPVYREDAAWPSGAQRFRDLWDETTAGLSGADARNAFRRAFEAA